MTTNHNNDTPYSIKQPETRITSRVITSWPARICHFKNMDCATADNGDGTSVTYWECQHCGHTIEINVNVNGA